MRGCYNVHNGLCGQFVEAKGALFCEYGDVRQSGLEVDAQVTVTGDDIRDCIKSLHHEPQTVLFSNTLFCRPNGPEEGKAITSARSALFLSSTFSSTHLTPELPPIDNELLPLLDFSSPSLSSNASIVERFDRISEHLFQRSYLVCCSTKRDGGPKRVLYELLEFEFYLIKPECHSDPFTHDGEDQRLSGAWSVQFLYIPFCIMELNFSNCKVLPSRSAAQRFSHLRCSRLP